MSEREISAQVVQHWQDSGAVFRILESHREVSCVTRNQNGDWNETTSHVSREFVIVSWQHDQLVQEHVYFKSEFSVFALALIDELAFLLSTDKRN